MTIQLGFTPIQIQVILARGGGFTQTLRSATAWPDGTVITLTFATSDDSVPVATWTAELVEWVDPRTQQTWFDAVFAEDDNAVRAVIEAGARNVRLFYADDSGADLVWGAGRSGVA